MSLSLPQFEDKHELNKVVLYENENTRVMRVQGKHSADTFIYKEKLRESAITRVRHECRILDCLSKIAGVSHLVDMGTNVPMNAIILEDRHCLKLEAVFKTKTSSKQLVDYAVKVSKILMGVHQAGVIHRDINPSNVMITGDTAEPILIDFDLSTIFMEERPAFVHHREIAGTLPYLAPEQTGRMGCSVDYRADLYSLGATLYELACHRPMFSGDDPLQVIHDILAKVPTVPSEINVELTPMLGAIIMRLLHKEPEQRYQSAEGLFNDLTKLSLRLADNDETVFTLGENNFLTGYNFM